MIHADKHIFSLMGDFTALLDRAATETIPPFREDKAGDQLSHRNAQASLSLAFPCSQLTFSCLSYIVRSCSFERHHCTKQLAQEWTPVISLFNKLIRALYSMSEACLLQDVDDYSRDYVERDEKRLADLGRRAVEMFAISHIFTDLQVQSASPL